MIYIILNVVPIGLATLAGLLVGFLWVKSLGGMPERRITPALAVVALVAEFWLASILAGALILAPRQAGEWTMAVGSAVVIWIGFVLPALAVTLLYRRLSARPILGDCAHWLVVMVLQAVVLKSYGLVPPPGTPGA
ncbi:DUF1761 domain-containing protein [Aureimonas leprariae]|uniref:DUF1761 domain-containing protein n=1 Tax=Plantimonas leprariae TaxID=2615207 RepID=A0A7V7TY29_9HYPH|nr:DUF1761 domain-containing protein [Aureimonas leprariae]KAB0682532.1 DUF1761 domain-containing protein [Aureimonas leprariae]